MSARDASFPTSSAGGTRSPPCPRLTQGSPLILQSYSVLVLQSHVHLMKWMYKLLSDDLFGAGVGGSLLECQSFLLTSCRPTSVTLTSFLSGHSATVSTSKPTNSASPPTPLRM